MDEGSGPSAVLGIAGIGYWLWATFGTEEPVEHHSSMPSEYDPPDG
ncbi:hypothetical protein OG871_02190 [Kitasatospora sp. NBC_00374]